MRDSGRGVMVLVGFVALALCVAGSLAILVVAEDKALAATLLAAVLALLGAAARVGGSLLAHWRSLPAPPPRLVPAFVASAAAAALVAVSVTWLATQRDDTAAGPPAAGERELVAVRGVVGSEKVGFFADPDVVDAFAAHGLNVTVEERGSRAMASPDVDLAAEADFAFPASVPTAVGIQERYGDTYDAVTPFGTPLVVASYEPVAEALAAAGLAHREDDGSWTLDVVAFVEAYASGTTWGDLGLDGFPPDRRALVRTTDPWSSNSGAMFLALAHHAAGRLAADGLVADAAPVAAGLIIDQGHTEPTTEDPFAAYLGRGLGFGPLVLAYEAQYVEAMARLGGPAAGGGERAVLYPEPTIVARHTLVPFDDRGAEVGRLLDEDPTLRDLARRHGFRTGDTLERPDGVEVPGVRAGIDSAATIDSPSFDQLEDMLRALGDEYRARGSEPPAG